MQGKVASGVKKQSKWQRIAVCGLVACLAVAMVCALSGCGESDEQGESTAATETTEQTSGGTISVQGSDTMVSMSQAWAEAFQNENEGYTVTVTGGGSGTGIAALIAGTTDFANASRELKDEESSELSDPQEKTVAYDGISIIVNPANGITEITSDELGKIYRGEVTNWSELGGDDLEITVCSRDTASGTYEFFKEAIVDGEEEQEITADALYLTSNQTILDEVAENEGAIGYIGLGYVDDSVNTLSLDGELPSVETVKDGSYTLSRGLYMDYNGEMNEEMQAFLDFVLSDEGQKIVEEQGFVSL